MTYGRLIGPAATVAAGLAFLVSGAAEARKVPTATVGSNYYDAGFKSVKAGQKVRFRWEGGGFELHDVNVERGPAKFRSPLQAGGTYTTKKLEAGRYVLFCSQHPDEMRMTLRVKR